MRSLADIFNQNYGKSELLRAAKAQIVLHRWPEIVGPLIAAQATPSKYRRGTVTVVCKNSALAMELRLRTEQIIEKLNTFAEDDGLFRSLHITQG